MPGINLPFLFRFIQGMGGRQFMRKSLIFVGILLLAGCDNKLETGYEPKNLNLSLSRQRALYADPYSDQAQEAGKDQDNSGGSQAHRPGTY